MNKRLLIGACLSLGLSLAWFTAPLRAEESTTPAASTELNVIAGREAGTYYQLSQDLKKLASRHQIDLAVIPSAGSLENIFKVYEYPSILLGFSQFDSLSLIAIEAAIGETENARELAKVVDSLRLVMPLYQEEVHVLAKSKEINKLADLNGKKVAVDNPVSGTHSTATILLELLKIKPATQLDMDAVTALQALQQGEIDALFYVVGAPARLFAGPFETADTPHLVAIELTEETANNALFQTFYRKAMIPAATYGWQDHDIPTVSVGTVLFTSDKGPDEEICRTLGRFARMVHDNLEWLKLNGHPKWKGVDLDRETLLKTPRLSPCVAQAFR